MCNDNQAFISKFNHAAKLRSRTVPNPEVKQCQITNFVPLYTNKRAIIMPKNKYIPRICDTALQNALERMGAVLIEGANGAVIPAPPQM
jgi:hypothetical protein